jgi:Uncharacterized protein conserved in bacteria
MSWSTTFSSRSSRPVDEWVAEYSKLRPRQLQFTTKLEALLREMIQIQGVEYHLLESRTKTEASFKEKIQRSSKSYKNPLEEVTDFTGIRIIVYYQGDADIIGRFIESEFAIDTEHSERHESAPSEFGYKSAHYVISIPSKRGELLEWQEFANLKAEVQIRTVLQHAWATISHKMQYKREADVPIVLRRRLFRLSALFELADDEFIALRMASSELTESIQGQLEAGERNIPVDYLSVESFILQSPELNKLVSMATEAGFLFEGINADAFDTSGNISDLIIIIQIIGLSNLAQLESVLRDSLKWAAQYFDSLIKTMGSGWGASPEFICEIVLIAAFRHKVDIADLHERLHWDPGIAAMLIDVAEHFRNSSG